MTIKEHYKAVLNDLAKEFSKLTDKQGEWTTDYELWITEFEAWTPTDMLYIVDNYDKLLARYIPEGEEKEIISYLREALLDDIEAWIDYNVEVATLGIAYINLKSWLVGCPRLSQKQIDIIKKHRKEFEDLIGAAIDEYGLLDTNPQPQHLRKLKTSIHNR